MDEKDMDKSPRETSQVIIRSCDECGLSAHSPGDGLWFCDHHKVRKTGDFINVTQMDGCPFTKGVHKRCPLRKSRYLYELAADVTFIGPGND